MADVLLCGVDEAGRGCVVGPLVITAFAAHPQDLQTLRSIGVADSKTLTPKKRLTIYNQLKKTFKIEHKIIQPRRITSNLRASGGAGLNELEYRSIAELVEKIRPVKVFVDSPDRNVGRARQRILQNLEMEVDVRCMVKGDRRHVLVAAASVAAKVVRDMKIERLKRELGDFGSGYPSDPKTRRWLVENKGFDGFSRHVRLGWKTLDRLKQTTLDQF
ncbi:MAG: ribonuclease HII [Candidatus Caldarchaeum sp.]|nr:ribonuclease HII [Candidatus Caldarchaeum sp.]